MRVAACLRQGKAGAYFWQRRRQSSVLDVIGNKAVTSKTRIFHREACPEFVEGTQSAQSFLSFSLNP